MKRNLALALLVIILLSACQTPTQEIVVVTATSEPPTAAPEVLPTSTLAGTNTPVPTATPRPTSLPTDTAEPTSTPNPKNKWAKNYLGAVESAGVTMEVVRVLVTDRTGFLEIQDLATWDAVVEDIYDDLQKALWNRADGAIEIIARFTNNASDAVTMRFGGESHVQIGSSQISLDDGFQFCTDLHYEDLWPDASAISCYWLPLDNMTPEEVVSITLRVEPPFDPDSYSDLGPWFIIELDVSEHRWEEMPDELK